MSDTNVAPTSPVISVEVAAPTPKAVKVKPPIVTTPMSLEQAVAFMAPGTRLRGRPTLQMSAQIEVAKSVIKTEKLRLKAEKKLISDKNKAAKAQTAAAAKAIKLAEKAKLAADAAALAAQPATVSLPAVTAASVEVSTSTPATV